MPRFQTIHNACSLYLHNYYYIYLHVNLCWLFPGGRITYDLRALSTSHSDDSLVHCFNRGKRSNLIVQMLQKSHVVTQLKEVSMSNFSWCYLKYLFLLKINILSDVLLFLIRYLIQKYTDVVLKTFVLMFNLNIKIFFLS